MTKEQIKALFEKGELDQPTFEKLMKEAEEAGVKSAMERINEATQKTTESLAKTKTDMEGMVNDLKKSIPNEEAIQRIIKAEIESSTARKCNALTKDEQELFMARLVAPFDRASTKDRDIARSVMKNAGELFEKMSPEKKTAYNNVGTGSEGGYLVPTVIAPMIMDIAFAENFIFQDADVIPMPPTGNVREIPTSLGGATVYWRTTEGDALTASKPSLGRLQITPKEYGAICYMTEKWLTMSNLPAIPWIIKEIAKGVAREMVAQVFAGTSLIGTGLRDSTTLASKTIAAATYDLTALECLVIPGSLSDDSMLTPKWYMNDSVWWAFFAGLKETTGGNFLFSTMWNNGAKSPLGYDYRGVKNSSAMPKAADTGAAATFAILADLKEAVKFGQIGVEQIAISTEAVIGGVSMFERNMVAIRANGIVGCGLPDYTGATPANYTGVKIISHA
jgi:HK97 family phage major capsid protein